MKRMSKFEIHMIVINVATVIVIALLILLGIAVRGWLINKFGITNYLVFFK